MDWSTILMWAEVADSPGRDKAVKEAEKRTKIRLAKKHKLKSSG